MRRATFPHRLITMFVMCVCLGLPACSRSPEKQVGVSLPTLQTSYYRSLRASLVTAARSYGLRLDIDDADGENARQIAQVQGFISQKVDAVLVVPLNSEAISRAILEANEAHVPVFTLDNTAGSGEVIAHIGVEDRSAGRAAGNLMLAAIANEGKVVIFPNRQQGYLKVRIQAFKDQLTTSPKVEVVAEVPAEGSEVQIQSVVTGLLGQYPDLAGILTTSDAITLAAVQSVTFAGRTAQVRIVGMGGPELQTTLKNGDIFGAIVQQPDRLAEQAIVTLSRYFQKATVPNLVPVAAETLIQRQPEARPYGAAPGGRPPKTD